MLLSGDPIQKTMRNLFWFIGGTNIVPSSRIIGAYIKRIEALIEQTNDSGDKGIAVNSSYGGPTYRDFLDSSRKGKNASMPGLNQIRSKIYMKVTINLYLPSLMASI